MAGAAAGRTTRTSRAGHESCKQAGNVQVIPPDVAHAEGGVGQRRPQGGHEDHQHGGGGPILDRVEEEGHPGQRRDGLEDLDVGVERAIEGGRQPQEDPEEDGDEGRGDIADGQPPQAGEELDPDPLVVGPVVVEGIRQHLPRGRPHGQRAGKSLRLAARPRGAGQEVPCQEEPQAECQRIDDHPLSVGPHRGAPRPSGSGRTGRIPRPCPDRRPWSGPGRRCVSANSPPGP